MSGVLDEDGASRDLEDFDEAKVEVRLGCGMACSWCQGRGCVSTPSVPPGDSFLEPRQPSTVGAAFVHVCRH